MHIRYSALDTCGDDTCDSLTVIMAGIDEVQLRAEDDYADIADDGDLLFF